MKKTFAVLMLATMLFSVGCGNQAQDAAKDAQQKVEQTANEAKDKAAEMKDDAAKKADEMKSDAAAKADEMKADADKMKADAEAKADEMKADAEKMAGDMTSMMNERAIALGGVMPGASLDDLTAMFGEPTSTDGDTLTFVDGLKVVLDGAKKVKSISTTGNSFDTPEGVYVGASEYSLNDYCGPYEYDSGDKKSVVVYKAVNGVITEITCSLK